MGKGLGLYSDIGKRARDLMYKDYQKFTITTYSPTGVVALQLRWLAFVVILLIRGIWATASYFQSNRNRVNNGGSSFATTQPSTLFLGLCFSISL